MVHEPVVYPFSAIVDQNELKLALLLNAINPQIGGVLIRGQKGTGKSLAVRALADLLPEIQTVKDCPFNCNPEDPTNMCENCLRLYAEKKIPPSSSRMKVATLPVGSTEDRVVGSLDIERAIREGVRALQPGILAVANQSILYADEVNLLPDHIVDCILDAAASGWNYVEREGVSVAHPARFILIGTMNPEEGELRPQLLDRFPIHVTIEGILDESSRVDIMTRNLEFSETPEEFRSKFEAEQQVLKEKIVHAKQTIRKVVFPPNLLRAIARACINLGADGHRPDISIMRSAKTLVAFEGRSEVTPDDVLRVAVMGLGHRTRRGGLEEPASREKIHEAFTETIKQAA